MQARVLIFDIDIKELNCTTSFDCLVVSTIYSYYAETHERNLDSAHFYVGLLKIF